MPRQAKLDLERHQILLSAIVDVPLQSAPFGVLRRHEALARRAKLFEALAEIGGEPDVLQRQSGLPGEVPEQLVLDRRQSLALALFDDERAKQLALVGHRDDGIRSRDGRHVVCGHRDRSRHLGSGWIERGALQQIARVKPHLGAAGARRLGEHDRHLLQRLITGDGLGDPLGKPRQHLVRAGPIAVNKTVRE